MENKSGVMAVPLSQLLQRTVSLTGFPVTDPRQVFPNNGRMLMVLNQMLQTSRTPQFIPQLQTESASVNTPPSHTRSCPNITDNYDDDFTSFEDQMKELMDRERKVQGFHSGWHGMPKKKSDTGFMRFDKLTDYVHDGLQVDLNKLVDDLVDDRVIETDVHGRQQRGAVGQSSDYLVKILSPYPSDYEESPRTSSPDEEVFNGAYYANEEYCESPEEYGDHQSGASWYGRDVSAMVAMMASDDAPADTPAISKAEKDKEKLNMFQTLKISALRKGYH